jgi:hypothetical protein|tara:strand:+ start:703 stop:1086 length:384 start_codon:yes stop_codon:yes gene_type:complete
MYYNLPCSIGELWDKYTILLIKLRNITNKEKLKNVENEKNYLDTFMKKFKLYNIDPLYIHLFETNKKLWNIEDNIRYKEYLKQFDDEFIELSRSVYMTNDKRCDIKKEINYKFNSSIIEEKEYNYYT